jgi:flavin-dependent dehydrogenase
MSLDPAKFQVAIVGAGPAGCVAASLLARAGFRVALIEQSRFPREKVCGECLSALGAEVLRRNNLLPQLPSHAVPLTHGRVFAGDELVAEVPLPLPMWGLSRSVLDTMLLDEARESAACVMQPARVEACQLEKCPVLTIRDLNSNQVSSVRANIVLIADGKGSLLHRDVPSTGSLGVKCHLTNVEGAMNCIHLFGVTGHYVGLAPIEGDRWNLAFTVPAQRVTALRGDLTALLASMKNENPALARHLHHAARVGAWHTCPLPRFPVASVWEENVIPLGNASAAIEPIGGEGMGLAIASAELASREIIASVREGRAVDLSSLRAEFRRLWNARQLGCRMAGIAISNRWLAPAAVRFLQDFPDVGSSVISFLGK